MSESVLNAPLCILEKFMKMLMLIYKNIGAHVSICTKAIK